MWRLTLARGVLFAVPAVCRILCSNVRGLAGNLSDLTVASSRHAILLCSETLVSDAHVSELLVPGFGSPVLLCRGRMPRVRGMAAYVQDGYGAFRQAKFECSCCEMLFFRICNLSICGVMFNVFLNHQVNWKIVCGAMQDLPWRNIWSADNLVEVLNEHLLLQVGGFVPTKVIRVRNKDKIWFDNQCSHAFDLKLKAHLRWTRDRSWDNWKEFVHSQVRANESY